jgi:enamine deaminase RidA (YjgF/YER057c/UK114 family)
VTDIADKDKVGRARRDFFEAPCPCSTLVEVKGLVFPELKVEIDAWARLDVDLSHCQ